jgi:hypothetical protein
MLFYSATNVCSLNKIIVCLASQIYDTAFWLIGGGVLANVKISTFARMGND